MSEFPPFLVQPAAVWCTPGWIHSSTQSCKCFRSRDDESVMKPYRVSLCIFSCRPQRASLITHHWPSSKVNTHAVSLNPPLGWGLKDKAVFYFITFLVLSTNPIKRLKQQWILWVLVRLCCRAPLLFRAIKNTSVGHTAARLCSPWKCDYVFFNKRALKAENNHDFSIVTIH